MLKNKIDKAFSILERLNQENEEEKEKEEKEKEERKKINKNNNDTNDTIIDSNNQLNEHNYLNNNFQQLQENDKVNEAKLNEIVSSPQFYMQLISFLLFIKQKYPSELKALKYLLTSYEPMEERVVLTYMFFCFGIHIYIASQSIQPIKYK